MRMALVRLCAALALLVPGCASDGQSAAREPQAAPDWRNVATAEDRGRLRDWRKAWTEALAKAQASGHAGDITAEAALLDPDAALGWEDPPLGLFHCRTIKVGAKSAGLLNYVAYPSFDCLLRCENGRIKLVKIGGSQRTVGSILPYSDKRKVFLGTLELGDETRPLEYGRDRERNLAALVERIGERRWRLVFPYPHFESTIDVIELVPKAPTS